MNKCQKVFQKESFSFTLTDSDDLEHHYSFFIKDFVSLSETIELSGRIILALPDEWEEFNFTLFCLPNLLGCCLFTLRMDTFDSFMKVEVEFTIRNEDNTVIPFKSDKYIESNEPNSLSYSEYGNRNQIIQGMKGSGIKVNAHIYMHLSCSEDIDMYFPRKSCKEQVDMMMKAYRDAYNDQNLSDLTFIVHDIKTKKKETVFLNKTMLAARSSYFDEILSANENATIFVEQQFEIEVVTTVLAYIYGHDIADLEEDVFKYLRIAFKYDLSYLLNRIDRFLCANMPKNDDELIFLELANKYNLQRLRRLIIEKHVNNNTDFDEFPKWKSLVEEDAGLEEELMRVLIIKEDEQKAQEMDIDEERENVKSFENKIVNKNQSRYTLRSFNDEREG